MKMLLQSGRGSVVHIYDRRIKSDNHILKMAICGWFATWDEKPWDERPITCERCLKELREGRRTN